jgi:hypothetical protein
MEELEIWVRMFIDSQALKTINLAIWYFLRPQRLGIEPQRSAIPRSFANPAPTVVYGASFFRIAALKG